MSDLFSTMVGTAGALQAYNRVLAVVQNNVANASTPGYVKQEQLLEALPFDSMGGLSGGVRAGEVLSARSDYADQAVRRQNSLLGQAQQDVNSLSSLQTYFDISGDSGIPKALNDLFSSFSGWAQSPDDAVARETVMQHAADVASAFQQASGDLTGAAEDTERQIAHTVADINDLAGQLRQHNAEVLTGRRGDAGLDAEIHSTLEQLSQYGDLTVLPQNDGTVTVLLNGQTPLVIGDHQYQISSAPVQPDDPPPTNPGGRPAVHIFASDGTDITGDTTGGQLGSLLDFHNSVLSSYLGDSYQQGDLNKMAQQFADRVNQLLVAGNISDGPPAQSGVPLFTYDSTNPSNVAATLSVAPGMTADQLAAIDPGPPYIANGTALALSNLEKPQAVADEINGQSYTQYYGSLAARLGDNLSQANNRLLVQQAAVAQAKDMQQQISGVSLDEEATLMIQFQRGYEANARLLTILDQLTQDTIDILQT
jgi:flagellar hook-associated protein 1 FlgK